ncbi:hypothetical protein WA171_000034 [Blastocystis sp. BT1]
MFRLKSVCVSRNVNAFYRSFASRNNVLFVLGAPGSGKGKHSDHLVAKFGGCHVSVGEILRETVKTPGKYTEMIQKHMNEGTLVPTEVTMELIRDKVMNSTNGVLLLDGYPRNMSNYKTWCDVMGDSCNVLGCLLYKCSYEFLEKRLIARGKDSGRADDNLEVIKRRFYSYEHETKEVLDKLREKYSIEEICTEPPFEEAFPNSVKAYCKIIKQNGLM